MHNNAAYQPGSDIRNCRDEVRRGHQRASACEIAAPGGAIPQPPGADPISQTLAPRSLRVQAGHRITQRGRLGRAGAHTAAVLHALALRGICWLRGPRTDVLGCGVPGAAGQIYRARQLRTPMLLGAGPRESFLAWSGRAAGARPVSWRNTR